MGYNGVEAFTREGRQMHDLKQLFSSVKEKPLQTIAVAAAEERELLLAIKDAIHLNLGNFILFGDQSTIQQLIQTIPDFPVHHWSIRHVNSTQESAMEAVKSVSLGESSLLMKGQLETGILLKEVLNRKDGLRSKGLLSHAMVLKLPKFSRLFILSDAAMNIHPTAEELKMIVLNAVGLAHQLEISHPKVALISALERVNPKIESSVKAQRVKDMFQENDLPFEIDGPLAVDLALDQEAAKKKGLTSTVAGNADILIVPSIDVGNALYKGIVFGTEGVQSAGIVLGAKVPIILTSRADSHDTKLFSIALGRLLQNGEGTIG